MKMTISANMTFTATRGHEVSGRTNNHFSFNPLTHDNIRQDKTRLPPENRLHLVSVQWTVLLIQDNEPMALRVQLSLFICSHANFGGFAELILVVFTTLAFTSRVDDLS